MRVVIQKYGAMLYNIYMLLTYQFKLNPTPEQVVILEAWGELLRRHWNYALGERLNWLRRTRSIIDRCSLICECKIPQPTGVGLA
ncbi:MAG: helix-turn-helix domain-containing protein [Nostoc sp.]|uniref:helix-turn-helix domain-containing protein n=1 Tax=Nostoc sp. TaxID=1180 RepID=UPI002FFC1DAB